MGPPLFVFFEVRGRGRGMFRLRAGYFPAKESSQSSPGLRARTRGSHSEGKPGDESTGAGADLWLCLRSPPAAALRWVRLVFIIPRLEARLVWQQSRGAVEKQPSPGGRCPRRGRMRGTPSTNGRFRHKNGTALWRSPHSSRASPAPPSPRGRLGFIDDSALWLKVQATSNSSLHTHHSLIHASLSQIPAEFRSRSQLGSAFAFALETMPMAANMVMMEEPP